MRDDGGLAFPKASEPHPNGGHYEWAHPGMTYRDWVVGQMMVRWWERNISPSGQFYMALRGEEAIAEVVRDAHTVVDVMLKERNK